MIQRHEFNTEWWGEEVGIVTDPAFFHLTLAEQGAALARFAWVEFSQPVSQLPSRRTLAQSGFFYCDTQIRFRLDMRNVELSRCTQELQVDFAADSPFEIQAGDLGPFVHERFYVLPGATEERVSRRYALWAANLIRDHAPTSLCLRQNDNVQGWFLAQPKSGGLELTLAMLSSHATVSGYDLYSRAITHFSSMDFRVGHASFSVRNSSVLNIYGSLGARFLPPCECWMWIAGPGNKPRSSDQAH